MTKNAARPDTCPSQEQLAALASGQLPTEDAARIHEHAQKCPACSKTLASLNRQLETLDSIGSSDVHTRPEAPPAHADETSGSAADGLRTMGVYQLIEKLGEGGMGAVYRALHPRLEREVALKVLPADRMQRPQAVARFEREMKAVGKLDHTNIVRAHDAGDVDGHHFLVMELVEGIDLAQLVSCFGPLPVADACELVRQAAVGLQHAHEHGMVHRDIKPSNLMLTRTGVVKVLDMGLALLGGPAAEPGGELTGTDQVMGTVDYMAPEQATDTHNVDIRADIYSLGATLYKLLAGEPPFSGEKHSTLTQKLIATANEQPPPIDEQRPDMPEDVAAIVHRCLAKKPEERYSSPAELAQALSVVVSSADLPKLLTAVGLEPKAASGVDSFVARAETPRSDTTIPGDGPRPKSYKLAWLSAAVLLAGVVFAGLWYFGVIFKIETTEGTLVLEINQPGAEVRVLDANGTVEIIDKSGKRQLRLKIKPGGKKLVVEKDGFELETQEFTLRANGEKAITVALAPRGKAPAVVQPQVIRPKIVAVTVEDPPTKSTRPDFYGIVPHPAKIPGVVRWQIETRQPRSSVLSVDWSPNGNFIAAGTGIGIIRIYDAATLRLVRVLSGHTQRVLSVAWSPNGEWLASTSADKTARLWSADGIAGPVLDPKSSVNQISWSPNSKRLAAWDGAAHAIRLWDVDGTPGPVLRGHKRYASAVAWSPDGKQLASAGDTDHTVRLWEADGTAGPVLRHEGRVLCVAWSGDGKWLVSGGADGARMWSVDGKPGPVIKVGEQVAKVAWSPHDKWLATVQANDVRFWKPDGKPGAIFKVRWLMPYAFSFGPDGRRFVTGGAGASYETPGRVALRVWDLDGAPQGEVPAIWSTPNDLAFSPTGKQFVSGHEDATVCLWDAGTTAASTTLNEADAFVDFVAWSPDGDRFAFAGYSSVFVAMADGASPSEFKTHMRKIGRIGWSPDGGWIAVAGSEAQLFRPNGTPGPVLKGHEGRVTGATWSPDGEWLATGGRDNTVRLWKADGTAGPVLETQQQIDGLAWSPDGGKLVVVGVGIQLWKADKQFMLEKTISHGGLCVAWSPDSQLFATASHGNLRGLVRLWQADGTPVADLREHTNAVTSVAFSSDGKWLISGGEDGLIIVRDAKSFQPVWAGLLLPDSQPASVAATGKLLHTPKAAEEHLVYVVESKPGEQKLLTPSQFQEQYGAALETATTKARESMP